VEFFRLICEYTMKENANLRNKKITAFWAGMLALDPVMIFVGSGVLRSSLMALLAFSAVDRMFLVLL
jgi:hypothetical protein